MEKLEKLPYSPAGNPALRAAFPVTIPVMTGYIPLGLAYGFLMASIGYNPLWALLMSVMVYGGSIEYVAITLLTSTFAPMEAFIISLMVDARQSFYGLSLLEKYRGMGRIRPFLICTLTDETYSLVSTLEVPRDVEPREFYFWISLLDYSYWLMGSLLGGILGTVLPIDTTGMDFVLTALFVVLFLEQWKKKEHRPAGVIGLVCTAVSLAVFGPDNLVVPAMVLVLAVLLGGRKKLCT